VVGSAPDMLRLAFRALALLALLLGGCGESERRPGGKEPPEAAPEDRRESPGAVPIAASASPEEVVRLWLGAAKRGDVQAASALCTEERRSATQGYLAEVASGSLRVESWGELSESAGEGQDRSVSGHVVFRGSDGGAHPENIEFRLVRRGGRWWIDTFWDYD
jgi:hypothetical protein